MSKSEQKQICMQNNCIYRQELEAKIDILMLEFCPDEMTKQQLENYEKHQKPGNIK